MSYNQDVLQCTFTETLEEKDKNEKKKRVVGSSTRHSKVDFISPQPCPTDCCVPFALLVNEVGMCVSMTGFPYLK